MPWGLEPQAPRQGAVVGWIARGSGGGAARPRGRVQGDRQGTGHGDGWVIVRGSRSVLARLDHHRAVELARRWGCASGLPPGATQLAHPPTCTARSRAPNDHGKTESAQGVCVKPVTSVSLQQRHACQSRSRRPMTARGTAGSPHPLVLRHRTRRAAPRRAPMPRPTARESMQQDTSLSQPGMERAIACLLCGPDRSRSRVVVEARRSISPS